MAQLFKSSDGREGSRDNHVKINFHRNEHLLILRPSPNEQDVKTEILTAQKAEGYANLSDSLRADASTCVGKRGRLLAIGYE